MRDNYDFSDAIKNPFAKKLKEDGHRVLIHYGPKDAAKKGEAKEYEPLPEEKAAFDEYNSSHPKQA